MAARSWEDLEQEGWQRRGPEYGDRASYWRPPEGEKRTRKVVAKRRDLSEEEQDELGDILLTRKKSKKQLEEQVVEEEDVEPTQEVGTVEVAEEMENRVEGQAGEEEVEEVEPDEEMKPQHKEQIMKMAVTLKDLAKEETGDIESTLCAMPCSMPSKTKPSFSALVKSS